MDSTPLSPARNVQDTQEIQVGAMATATGQNASAKGRVLVSIVEGTLQTPAMIVVEIEECAMAIATGQMGSAEGSVI